MGQEEEKNHRVSALRPPGSADQRSKDKVLLVVKGRVQPVLRRHTVVNPRGDKRPPTSRGPPPPEGMGDGNIPHHCCSPCGGEGDLDVSMGVGSPPLMARHVRSPSGSPQPGGGSQVLPHGQHILVPAVEGPRVRSTSLGVMTGGVIGGRTSTAPASRFQSKRDRARLPHGHTGPRGPLRRRKAPVRTSVKLSKKRSRTMNQDVTRAPRRGKEGRNERGGGRLGQIDPQSRLSGEQGLHRGREACTDSDVWTCDRVGQANRIKIILI